MGNLTLSLDRLNEMKPLQIVKDEAVKQRFILIYSKIWTRGDENEAEAVYEHESIAFTRALSENTDLQSCTNFSIFSAFIDLAVCGLSMHQGTCPQCYLLKRSTKIGETVGRDGKKYNKYENRVNLTVSGYGELVMRERAGQIRHADNPIIVYANDEFSFTDKGGRKQVDYTCHLPHDGQLIAACFMRITRADGSVDYAVMLPEDWGRLAGYSARQNSYYKDGQRVQGNANALYTSNGGSIDTGFLKAKCIKHAFKTYPKVKIGGYTVMEADATEDEDFYGLSDGTTVDPETGEVLNQPEPEPQPFGESEQPPQGVTVNADEEEGF